MRILSPLLLEQLVQAALAVVYNTEMSPVMCNVAAEVCANGAWL